MNATFFHDSKFKYDKNGIYYATGGLTQNYLKGYLKYFEKLTIVTRKEKIIDNIKYSIASCKKIEFKCFENFNILKLLMGVYNKEIKKQVENSEFCIIRLPSLIGYKACKYTIKLNKPYIIESVGCPRDSLWYHGGLKYKILLPYMVYLTKKEIKRSKYTTYVTEKFLQKRYPTKGKSISCSDVSLKDIKDNNLDCRKKQIINLKDKIVIGTIGALNIKYKGQQYVIKALSELKKQGIENIEYQLVGTGNKEILYHLAKKYKMENNVKFIGTLPHEDIFNWFDNINIYIQPSLTEGMPRALIEAMSRACPCAGSKVGGIPELIDEECLFKRKSVNDIINVIKKMISDKKFLINEAEINYNNSKKFNKNILNKKRDIFYENIIKDIERGN